MGVETKRERSHRSVRRLRSEDAAAIATILRDSPEAANWTEAGLREMAERGEVVAFAGEADGEMTGFVVARRAGDEGEILNLAVRPANRRKGEGAALLRATLKEFRALGVRRVFLEVRESNERGVAFYAKHGFTRTGKRRAYYREPEEAAIVMEMALSGQNQGTTFAS